MCSIVVPITSELAFFRSEAPTKIPQRALTFAERVAYQRAIEDVYWRHRIWPNDHHDPKPSLDSMMPQAQLERKVVDYLCKSQALEDYWHRSITTEQLQAEMDRMVQHTKQPEVLHELFEALGSDPFVIAECLARPVLAERTLATVASVKQSRVAKPKPQVPLTMAATRANYALPVIASPSDGCTEDTWTPTSLSNVPTGRTYHTAVWTGSEMIVWGGYDGANHFDTGATYNPSTDSWTATSTINAPTGRYDHTAVWTGTEMIIWGGTNFASYLNTGGRYNPSTDSWTAISITNAPDPRDGHSGVWTGSEMIVWGGTDDSGYFDTGGRYNPSTDSWTATNITFNLPDPRAYHTAVWTGSEMIVWGGYNSSQGDLNTGGRYNPSTDSWIVTSTSSAPELRASHTAVWTGSEMIVWGGVHDHIFLNTGARYNPALDSWIATSSTKALDPRAYHTAVWTGAQMIVWGGYHDFNAYFNTGARYNPSTDSWIVTSTSSAPEARASHTGVWTGREMIVWGGVNWGSLTYFNTGGRYCAEGGPSPTPTPTASPTPTPTPTASPTPTPSPTAPTATPTSTGTPTPVPNLSPWTFVARYDYHIDAPAVTTDGTFLYSAGGNHYGATNRFFRYNPVANGWSRFPDALAPFYAARAVYAANTNSIYVFGGVNNTVSDTTQIYNIGTGTWRNGAPMPAPRYFSNLAYYPGNGKIYVIGGFDTNDNQQSQTWEYDPVANTWDTSRRPIPNTHGWQWDKHCGQLRLFGWRLGCIECALSVRHRYQLVDPNGALARWHLRTCRRHHWHEYLYHWRRYRWGSLQHHFHI
jgi:N-acetylneuraminic acid mutarotase